MKFTTEHAKQVAKQWRANMILARVYAKEGKPEHAAYAYKMARQNVGIRDEDQEYA